MSITFNQLIEKFEDLSNQHLQIKRFGSGPIEDVNTFSPSSGEFPVLWIVPQNVRLSENILTYIVRVLVFDINETDDSIRNEILSDTLLILNDIFQQLKNDDDNYEVSADLIATPFNQRFVDYCTGWFADIEIITDINNSLCIIPNE
jgi:hypothetical protein